MAKITIVEFSIFPKELLPIIPIKSPINAKGTTAQLSHPKSGINPIAPTIPAIIPNSILRNLNIFFQI